MQHKAEDARASGQLAKWITWNGSKHTYYTIRLLVDQHRIVNAFRAYAYFRWVDDWLDQGQTSRDERLTFIMRQQALLDCGYDGAWPADLSEREVMLFDLLQSDEEVHSGLQSYLRHMMAVMTFDARRRGSLISQQALAEYTEHLAIAVTEALH